MRWQWTGGVALIVVAVFGANAHAAEPANELAGMKRLAVFDFEDGATARWDFTDAGEPGGSSLLPSAKVPARRQRRCLSCSGRASTKPLSARH